MLAKNKQIIKATLLMVSSLTVMSGATIAPSLPQMSKVFETTPNAEFLSKLVLTLPALMIAIVSPIVGHIIDKFGRLKLLFIALVVYALGGTTGLYFNDLYAILAGRALLGIAVAGVMTTATTLIADYLEGTERNEFMGMQGAFMALGGMVFVGSGGALADIGWRYPFLLYFFSLIILPLTYIYFFEPDIKKASLANTPQTLSEKPSYSRFLVNFIYLVTFLSMLLFYIVPVQLPFLLKDLGIEKNSLAGFAIVVSTFTGAIVSFNYRRIKARLSYMHIYAISFALLGIGFNIVGAATNYTVVLIGMGITGLGMGFLLPNPSLWLMSLAPAEIRGRLIGGLTMAVFIGQFFSPIVSDPIANQWSLAVVFIIAGSILCILAIGFVWGNQYMSKQDKRWQQMAKISQKMP